MNSEEEFEPSLFGLTEQRDCPECGFTEDQLTDFGKQVISRSVGVGLVVVGTGGFLGAVERAIGLSIALLPAIYILSLDELKIKGISVIISEKIFKTDTTGET